MSIYTDMIPCELFVNQAIKGSAGALQSNYVKVQKITAAVYKNDSFKSIQNVKYEESTHNGLTFYKGFEDGKEYRLQVGSALMDVTYFNTAGRYTILLLKEITYG